MVVSAGVNLRGSAGLSSGRGLNGGLSRAGQRLKMTAFIDYSVRDRKRVH